MIAHMYVSEMAATVERERMVDFARRGRVDQMARAGQMIGQQGRTRKMLSAFLQRMGRPLDRGSAPAGGDLRNSPVTNDPVRPATESLSTAGC
jgi:hypothetical protein